MNANTKGTRSEHGAMRRPGNGRIHVHQGSGFAERVRLPRKECSRTEVNGKRLYATRKIVLGLFFAQGRVFAAGREEG